MEGSYKEHGLPIHIELDSNWAPLSQEALVTNSISNIGTVTAYLQEV